MTRCLPVTEASLDEAAALLRAGEVVALPTETVYGLAADATRIDAVQRIYAAKERPADNPLIVHVGRRHVDRGRASMQGLVDAGWLAPLPPGPQRALAERLAAAFWPGPLTLVLPKGPRIPAVVSAGLPTVGIRMPAHEAFLRLLERLDCPLAAPSANRANRISPTSAADVEAELGGRIPLVLDGGRASVGLESTIVQVGDDGQVRLLRPGGLPLEALARAAGVPLSTEAGGDPRLSPGRRPVHYAPRKPVLLCAAEEDPRRSSGWHDGWTRIAVLLLSRATVPGAWRDALTGREVTMCSLEDAGPGHAAARGLFAALRSLDTGAADVVLAELPLEAEGLWPAVRDRLARAAAPRARG